MRWLCSQRGYVTPGFSAFSPSHHINAIMAESETKSPDGAPVDTLPAVNSGIHSFLRGIPVIRAADPSKTLHIEASKSAEEALKLLATHDVTEAHVYDDTTSVCYCLRGLCARR